MSSIGSRKLYELDLLLEEMELLENKTSTLRLREWRFSCYSNVSLILRYISRMYRIHWFHIHTARLNVPAHKASGQKLRAKKMNNNYWRTWQRHGHEYSRSCRKFVSKSNHECISMLERAYMMMMLRVMMRALNWRTAMYVNSLNYFRLIFFFVQFPRSALVYFIWFCFFHKRTLHGRTRCCWWGEHNAAA